MEYKRAIVVSGGTGTRLSPITSLISKQSLPIYDKPMIYYPLSIIFLLKIKNILIVTDRSSNKYFKNLLGNGKKFGVKFSYKIQKAPLGIAHALKINKNFIKKKKVCVILGDNIFYGTSLLQNIKEGLNKNGANIFGYFMKNPNKYGVIKLKKNKVLGIYEKPKKKISNYAIPGLYFFDQKLEKYLKQIKFSLRNELEIVDVLKKYHKNNELNCKVLNRNIAWLDTGTPNALLSASNFIKTIEKRKGIKIGCLEKIALNNKWITKMNLARTIKINKSSNYFKFLKTLI